MVTVRVHPNFVVSYYGFYLEGLGRVFGFDNIRFDREGFPEHTEHNDGFAFTVTTGAAGHRQTRRFYVSANDFARYDRVALDWCDRYGMVNHDPALLGAADTERVVAIGPSFGVRDWGGLLRTGRDVRRLIRAGGGVFWTDQRRHGPLPWLKNSRKQLLDRLPEQRYVPVPSDSGYVFFVSWAWKQGESLNRSRAHFVRACRSIPGLRFEGGFAPRRRNDIPSIADVTADRFYPFREWLTRTQRSAVVFNSPALHDCLGWKLGEFLALGKAIVSLPLSRVMPAPLVHGEHVHYTSDDEQDMRDAVERLTADVQYRARLEAGARRYYSSELAPERVIRRLVDGK